MVVLALIGEAPKHGYELIKAIEERTGGLYAPSPGVIYPTLTLLEEIGLIAQHGSEGPKKQYAITAEGSAELERESAVVGMLMRRMSGAGTGRADNSPIFRAMQNLRLALRGRLTRTDASKEVVLAAAAAIDEAASRVERL